MYALALADDLVTAEQAQRVLHIVDERLRTPVGLRTLAPEDMRCGQYAGGVLERDRAYHQGTVWPFSSGRSLRLDKESTAPRTVRQQARSFLQGLEKTAWGTPALRPESSEIFDGQAPHRPGLYGAGLVSRGAASRLA
ncbi:MAG: amylo-alpha-1,6-glucosidase [Nitrospiraceae bacterium]